MHQGNANNCICWNLVKNTKCGRNATDHAASVEGISLKICPDPKSRLSVPSTGAARPAELLQHFGFYEMSQGYCKWQAGDDWFITQLSKGSCNDQLFVCGITLWVILCIVYRPV